MNNLQNNLFLLILFCLFLPQSILGQSGTVKGKIIDSENRPINGVRITVLGGEQNSRSQSDGSYSISVPTGKQIIRFTHPTHETAQLELEVVSGYTYDRSIKMLEISLEEAVITDEQGLLNAPAQMQLIPIKAEEIIQMPRFNRSVEAVMQSMPGVATNNEFSSQYQVRGGNFDENLVYVNGIEIYRPFLARSGQQEGLGFANPDMTEQIEFSTGGFSAQYGDRLSSVLDITYRTPKSFRATVEAGFITTSLHAEGTSKNKHEPDRPGRLTYNLGARRFNSSYLLNSLETRGEYRPNFLDFQGMFTYTPKTRKKAPKYKVSGQDTTDVIYYPNDRIKLTTFFALTRNRYVFEPTGSTTTIGTLQQAIRIRTGFEGREISSYTTGLGALMLTHQPTARLRFDYTFTAFRTEESELFDVEGGYLIGEVNTNFFSDEFNESDFDLGIGSEYRHARNFLTANVISAQARGRWISSNTAKHRLSFGLKFQRQDFEDELLEYSLLDSAGYVVTSNGEFGLQEFISNDTSLVSNLYKGFLQHEFRLDKTKTLISGARIIYYDLIDQWMFSPRFQFVYDMSKLERAPKMRLRLAAGVYHQPPFFREFRRFDGSLNVNIDPQRSLHLIGGLDYQFKAWGRDFKLFSELYYKRLNNLIPYEVQNVRIRYYPDEVATGYAYGWDARLSGQFIKGVESWISVGLLKTEEDIERDERGSVPRPTDQRFTFSMYFQDELPSNPTFKVHINYIFGSGMRFGPPRLFEQRTSRQFPAYHRLDIGFSKLITFNSSKEKIKKHGLESLWATLEIFNLLQRENTVSYVWIEDLNNTQYAVPNRLSARLVNLRLIMRFR